MRRRDRNGSLLPVLLAFMLLAGYAGLEAGTNWDALIRRDREEELAARLVRLQRAVDAAHARLGRAPAGLTEVAALEPPVLPRIPLDPYTGTAGGWRLVVSADGRARVRSTAAEEAFDGSNVGDWEAEPIGFTWRIRKGGGR